LSCAMFLVFIIFLSLRPYMNPYGAITMLDIGQGDAFIIELPYRKGVFIVDAGATFTFEQMEPTENVYKNIIRPYLYGKGIYKIDSIFISHEHVDHDGSIPFLLDQFPVGEIVVSEYFIKENSSLKNVMLPLRIVQAGETYKKAGFKWEIVAPIKD